MGDVLFFRRGARGGGWLAAARGLGPLLLLGPMAAFLAVLLLPGGSGAVESGERSAAHFARCSGPVRVTCVVDGDTIWLDGEKIRLADINTPEVSSPACPAEAELGVRATTRLIALLNEGPFTLAPNPDGRDEDRYGRKLRVVTRGGESLGATLVREGLAEEWRGSRRGWC